MITPIAERRWALEGSPADCVLAGLGDLVKGPVDLVLSGVNRGNNAGENAVYSGTLGAAMEGALQGVPSIALSQFYGPRNVDLDDPFEAARVHGADTVRRLLAEAPWGGGGADAAGDDDGYKLFYNVNFPPVPAAKVAGIAAVSQGYRGDGRMHVQPQVAPSGRRYLWMSGSAQTVDTGPGTDVAANAEGWTSVTPMRADLTDRGALAAMGAAFPGPSARPAG
jgi:5'-nucleotidase